MYCTDVLLLTKQLVEASIILTIFNWIVWLNPEADEFFIAAGIVLLVVLSLGYPIINVAQAIAPFLVITFMNFSGYFIIMNIII